MLLGAWVLSLTSCSTSDSPSDDGRLVRMPIVLAIPANDASLTAGTAGAKATRAEGDPGTYEKFELPKYLYLYLLNTSIDGTRTTLLEPEGMNGATGYPLDKDKWVKTTTQDSNKDSIYTYTDEIRIIIPEDRRKGVVYAAMSTVPITVSGVPERGTSTDAATIEKATFALGSDATGKESEALKNLYSSPYNNIVNGTYYGTVSDYKSNSPYINMVLYHVASKLDLQWNVDASVQDKVKLSKIELSGLSSGGYLFKPLENTSASTSSSTSAYTETFTLDAGSQWYGRQALYVIPVNNGGSYQFPMTLTNSVSNPATTTTAPAKVTPSATNIVFVPWMVGTVKITKSW